MSDLGKVSMGDFLMKIQDRQERLQSKQKKQNKKKPDNVSQSPPKPE